MSTKHSVAGSPDLFSVTTKNHCIQKNVGHEKIDGRLNGQCKNEIRKKEDRIKELLYSCTEKKLTFY